MDYIYRDDLRGWWGSYRGRALRALSQILGIDRATLLKRLRVKSEDQLAFPKPGTFDTDPKPKRPRGRPRRELDPFTVRRALEKHHGNVRATARALGVPRSTLARFIDREVRGLDRLERIAYRLMRNSKGRIRPMSGAMMGAKRYEGEDRKRLEAIIRREYERLEARKRKPATVIPLRPENASNRKG